VSHAPTPAPSARLAVVGTFPPTQCGLATFAHSLVGGFAGAGVEVDVVSLVAGYPTGPAPGVARDWLVDHETPAEVAAALDGYDVVVLQHEYGIYPGADGDGVIALMRLLHVPVVTVLHTVLEAPTDRQRAVLVELVSRSAAVVTMTRTARLRVISTYGARPERVHVVPHGAADDLIERRAAPRRPGPGMILTWGLLGRGKGIEWGIRALAMLDDVRPGPTYVVAGRTHPQLRERDGEAYRRELVALAAELGVSDRVRFEDGYLGAADLHALVRAADVVLLPYDSLEQVTSGVLAEAIAAGRPVVASRFPHAVELLGGGAGLLVDRGDSTAIAAALRRVLTEPLLAEGLGRRARRIGLGLSWRAVAADYLRVCDQVLDAETLTGTSDTPSVLHRAAGA